MDELEERERGVQPLDDAATACTLAFVAIGRMYQPMSALAVLAGLHAGGFAGVCECYIRPGVRDGEYLMGVGLGFEGDAPGDAPGDAWWGSFADNLGAACSDDEDVRLDRGRCEFATVGELRAAMLHAGTAGFKAGLAVWVSDPAGPDPDSPFTALCRTARGE